MHHPGMTVANQKHGARCAVFFLEKGRRQIVAASPAQKPCNVVLAEVPVIGASQDFALQQTLLTTLLKGQWHFPRLLCIGAAGMNGWEPRISVVR
jgi:hypothetical protein